MLLKLLVDLLLQIQPLLQVQLRHEYRRLGALVLTAGLFALGRQQVLKCNILRMIIHRYWCRQDVHIGP